MSQDVVIHPRVRKTIITQHKEKPGVGFMANVVGYE